VKILSEDMEDENRDIEEEVKMVLSRVGILSAESRETLSKVDKEEDKERKLIVEKIRDEIIKRKIPSLGVLDFDLMISHSTNDKVFLEPEVDFRANVSYPYYMIEVSNDEVLRKAKELGVPEKFVDKNHPEFSPIIHLHVTRLVGYEKLKNNPSIFEFVFNTVVSDGEKLKRFIDFIWKSKLRARGKLEEVS